MKFTGAVLGVVMPRVWVVTTPNRDYNPLFPDWVPGQTRHWDHKFEWSRSEMGAWVERVLESFPLYEVELDGVGWKEGCRDSHGPASQMAIFRRGDWSLAEQSLEQVRTSSWNLLASSTFPANADTRSRTEKIYDELMYYVNFLSYEQFISMTSNEPYEVSPEEIIIKFEDVLKFDSMNKLETSVQELTDLAAQKGETVTEEGLMISLNKFVREEESEEEVEDGDTEEVEESDIEKGEEKEEDEDVSEEVWA